MSFYRGFNNIIVIITAYGQGDDFGFPLVKSQNSKWNVLG